MTGIIIFVIILVIIGALLGRNTLGESIRGGCGCVIAIVIIVIVLVIAFIMAIYNDLI